MYLTWWCRSESSFAWSGCTLVFSRSWSLTNAYTVRIWNYCSFVVNHMNSCSLAHEYKMLGIDVVFIRLPFERKCDISLQGFRWTFHSLVIGAKWKESLKSRIQWENDYKIDGVLFFVRWQIVAVHSLALTALLASFLLSNQPRFIKNSEFKIKIQTKRFPAKILIWSKSLRKFSFAGKMRMINGWTNAFDGKIKGVSHRLLMILSELSALRL